MFIVDEWRWWWFWFEFEIRVIGSLLRSHRWKSTRDEETMTRIAHSNPQISLRDQCRRRECRANKKWGPFRFCCCHGPLCNAVLSIAWIILRSIMLRYLCSFSIISTEFMIEFYRNSSFANYTIRRYTDDIIVINSNKIVVCVCVKVNLEKGRDV